MSRKLGKAAVTTVGIIVVGLALYIMANHLGLVDSLDFGAGAYYYADIPGFDKILKDDSYQSPVSTGLCVILFLAWGLVMYKLWCWIDKHSNK